MALDCAPAWSQVDKAQAPGGPGKDAHWPTAAKNGFGTANNRRSKVWFTLADGVLTEVYYPTIDLPNVQSLQLIVVTPEGRVETESEDTTHAIEVKDNARSLSFRQENKAKDCAYIISKTYVTDPQHNTLLIHVSFRSWVTHSSAYRLYVYYDPSLNNSGLHDAAWTEGGALLAADADKASALVADPPFAETTNGFLGRSDGLTELRQAKGLSHFLRAADGNVVQAGRPASPRIVLGNWISFTLALGFGKTAGAALTEARGSLARGFDVVARQYEASWHDYVDKLVHGEAKRFYMAVMVLKALEDKTYRGAIIASPSIPWGGGPNANEATISGYHAVWSRDLYQVATALLAIGDRAAAYRALDYLFKVQQRPDGSFPQNSWVDGKPIGGGLQLDQVSLPLVLAYQLSRADRLTWSKHVKPAADFIMQHGPATGQDRWEEKSGYSPATIAAEIAGLVCAADIAKTNGAVKAARSYLKKADEWASNVDRWTATTNGPYGDGHYYLRITENDDPNDGAKLEINSGGGTYDEREIVDAGFLELVRLGIKLPNDPLILKSIAVVDKLIRMDSSGGPAWYRYNHDAYGERPNGGPYDGRNGKGRLWTLLTGERGEYELARRQRDLAGMRLNAMMAYGNDGMMVPEQIWDRKEAYSRQLPRGLGTGSATPLAWSMAQLVRLAMNIRSGRNLETPQIVARRYLNGSRTRR